MGPGVNFIQAARECGEPHYVQDLEPKIEQRDCNDFRRTNNYWAPQQRIFEASTCFVARNVTDLSAEVDYVSTPYNGVLANISQLNFCVGVGLDERE